MTAVSGVSELANLIPEIWSPLIYAELRNQLMIADVFNHDYEGEIRNMGDTVRVNTILAPSGQILTDDKQSFETEAFQVTQQSITVNKRAVAAFEFTDLAQLQSMAFEQDAREALVYALRKQIETSVLAALIPSASAPNHQIAPASASDLAAVDVATMRTLLSLAKVPKMNRYLFLDPNYYGDLLNKTTFTSSDFIQNNGAVSSGEFASPLYGFRIAESDFLGTDIGYAIHPSALTMVMQQSLRMKISDLHGQKNFGYVMSADLVFDYKLMDNTRIVKISG